MLTREADMTPYLENVSSAALHAWAGPKAFRVVRLKVPATTASVPGARHRVRRAVVEWGGGDLADTAELLFCELLSNAIQHASREGFDGTSSVAVTIIQRCEVLAVAVGDSGCGTDAVVAPCVPPDDDAESGRGLLLVEALAGAWGSCRTAGGTLTWFALERRTAP